MTNLTFSLELAKAISENEFTIEQTIDFLCADHKKRVAYAESIDMIRKIDRLLLKLIEEGAVTLEDGDHSINFFNLCDAIQAGEVHTAYRSCKVIRAEMLIETTADKLEDFKRLSEYWETLELNFGMLLK